MPAIFAAIGVFLASLITPLIARILKALGLSLITYVGVDTLTDRLLQEISTQFQGLPANIAGMVGLLSIDTAITIIISAHVAAISLQGIKNGAKGIGKE